MALTFLLPDPDAFVSGGNVYNAALLAALRGTGEEVRLVNWDHFSGSDADSPLWVDSLFLKEWAGLDSPPPARLIVHHLPGFYPEPGGLSPETEAKALGQFQGFLCTSEYTRSALAERGIPADRCLVLEPGSDLVAPSQRGYPAGLEALLVANVIPRKNILPLLEALAENESDWGDFRLNIAGETSLDPGYATDCLRFLDGQPRLAERISWLGSLSRSALSEAYLRHSLLISPSAMETYGMAIREGQSFGLPLLLLNGGYAGRHAALSPRSAWSFGTVEELAQAFLLLSKKNAALQELTRFAWQERPLPISWDDQARQFISQLTQWTN